MRHLPTGSQMQASALPALCPSFGSYCSSKIAEIGSRVMEAMAMDNSLQEEPTRERPEHKEPAVEQNEEGEFTFVSGGSRLPPLVAADEIFHNGRIRPLCPVVHEAVLSDIAIQNNDGLHSRNSRKRPSRMPLKKLMSKEQDDTFASWPSSSEADELDGVAPELYCAWTPKSPGGSQARSKSKSNSSRHSKRWKLKDILSD